MIDVRNRIGEILSRMAAIRNRFYKKDSKKPGFQKTLSEVQEKIYSERLRSKLYTKYDNIIREKSEKYMLPVKLIKSVIKQESNFNPKAVSPKNAKGLMQIMPQTQKLLNVKDVFNPEENIEAGTKYLRMMINRFNGDLEKALAAYNAGPEAVEKYNRIPNYDETKNYVKNVIKNMRIF